MTETMQQKITVQEFDKMAFLETDFFIYELINGMIMRKAAPQPFHQFVVRRLSKAFEKLLDDNPIGEFLTSPIDVFFDNYNRTQPDLLFINKDRTFIIDLYNSIQGAPDLIVEVISPGSIKIDRIDKKELYEQFAVKEYWIVDPHNKSLEIYIFKDDKYRLHQFLEVEGKIESTILVGFDLTIQTLFNV